MIYIPSVVTVDFDQQKKNIKSQNPKISLFISHYPFIVLYVCSKNQVLKACITFIV